MTEERETFSRKELSGWGDSSEAINKQLRVEDLPNRINPQVAELYQAELAQIVEIILKGLHLEAHTVIQRKYNLLEEDTIFVYEFLRNILLKRALKKLSYLMN